MLLTKAIEVDPRNAGAYRNRGNIYMEKRDFKRALEDLDRAVEINPTDAVAVNIRGVTYLRMKQVDKAMEHFTEATRC